MTDQPWLWPPWRPPHPPPDPPVSPRRRRVSTRTLGVCAVVGMLLAAGGTTGAAALGRGAPVVVEVSGPGSAHVTWWVGGEETNEPQAGLPWRLTAPGGTTVSVKAQLLGAGRIACTAGSRPPRAAVGEYPSVACTIG